MGAGNESAAGISLLLMNTTEVRKSSSILPSINETGLLREFAAAGRTESLRVSYNSPAFPNGPLTFMALNGSERSKDNMKPKLMVIALAGAVCWAQPGPGPGRGMGDGIWTRNAAFGEFETFDL